MNIQRNTIQRQIVWDTLKKLNNHPTIEEIYAQIQKEHPAISKTTIYRNLRQLAQNGMIRQVSLPDGLTRYDAYTGQHHHFQCKNCGAIFDVNIEYAAGVNEMVQQKYGFHVDEHDVVFRGACLQCGESRK